MMPVAGLSLELPVAVHFLQTGNGLLVDRFRHDSKFMLDVFKNAAERPAAEALRLSDLMLTNWYKNSQSKNSFEPFASVFIHNHFFPQPWERYLMELSASCLILFSFKKAE